ncbi:MAG: hypothetical protein BGO68_00740 [Candidatus Amoebophilus sp. 36-38]|nr:MAG: hypothetical protein BGO68_00740 [Candidatus Amoebophilus sp. 36-38]
MLGGTKDAKRGKKRSQQEQAKPKSHLQASKKPKAPKTNIRKERQANNEAANITTAEQQPDVPSSALEAQSYTDVLDITSQSTIETLAAELLQGIFSYLTFEEMLPVRNVNHFFHTLTTGYNRIGVVGIENKPDSRKLVDSWYLKKTISFKYSKKFKEARWTHETIPSFIFYQFMETVANLLPIYWSCLPFTQIKKLLLKQKKRSVSQAAELGKYLVVGSKGNYQLAKVYEHAIKEETLELKKGTEKVLKLYNKAAYKGHIKAQLRLGSLYMQNGPNQSFITALTWYLSAARRSNKIAQYNLARIIQKGRGVKRPDEDLIFKWYKAAAKQGYSQAQYELAKLYKAMEIYHKALIYFERAGIKEADFEIGAMHEEGLLSGQPNYAEAIAWYEKAATQNHKKSLSNLALIYFQGLGSDQPNKKKASEYAKKALRID